MKRYFLIPIFLLSVALATGCGEKQATPSAQDPHPEKTRIPISEKTSVDPQAMADLSWWHRNELVADLKLDPDQQKRMDAHLEELLLGWQPNLLKRRGAQKRFAMALKAGEFEKARKVAEDLGQAEAYFSSGSLVLKAEVLSELSPEQLQVFLEKYPKIFKGRWITSGKLTTRRQPK